MKAFEANHQYYTGTGARILVTKRTAKTATVTQYGVTKRCKVEQWPCGVKTEVVLYKLDDDLTIDALRLQKVLRWTGSKSVTLYRQTGSGSALKPLRGTTESGDLLVICPIRCAA